MRKLLCASVILLAFASLSFAAITGIDPDVKNSLVKVGSDVLVPIGANIQSAVAVGGNVDVFGTIQKDAVAVGGDLMVRKSAVIHGDAVCIGGKLIKEPGATITGDNVEISVANLPGLFIGKSCGWGLSIIGLVSFLSFLILALFAAAFFPNHLGRISYFGERMPGASFLWGLLMIVLIIPIIILLAVSLIGIIFIPFYLILLAGAAFFGYIAVSQLLGKKILKGMRLRNKPMMIEVVVGFIFLEIINLIPLIGWLIKIIAVTMGLGAVLATRFGTKD